MKYTARKPFRYGAGVFLTGQHVTVSDADDVKMLQSQGKIAGPVMETATAPPVEMAMKPAATYKPDYSEMTVMQLRDALRAQGEPTYGTKAELIERIEGD